MDCSNVSSTLYWASLMLLTVAHRQLLATHINVEEPHYVVDLLSQHSQSLGVCAVDSPNQFPGSIVFLQDMACV
jgi:hypothetical protein